MADNKNTSNEVKAVRTGKTNGYKSNKLHANRNRKRIDAEGRQAEHDSLTTEEKIAKAKSRRGNSNKELARLAKILEATKVKVESKPIGAPKTSTTEVAKPVNPTANKAPSTVANVKPKRTSTSVSRKKA